jgi:protein-L-isoaspartate(D-aspartate) O-methyltransferase
VRRGRWPARIAFATLVLACPVLSRAAPMPPARTMIDQLRARGIHDERVLEAMGRVRREAFMPDAARGRAYADEPLPIGHGQTISQPYVVALMTELLQLRGNERVLEIGTGSGYQAAVLAEVAREVYSVEIIPELAATARLCLTSEGYRNVHVKQGDGALGWRDYGPYDAIVVTAAAVSVPRALIDQLREGGVLVMPVGEPEGRQMLVRGVKRGIKLRTREVAEVRFVPMTGETIKGESGTGRGGVAPPVPRARDEGAQGPRVPGNAPHGDSGPVTPTLSGDGDSGTSSDGGVAPGTPPRGRGLIEEDLPDRESGTRSLRGARSRAARAPAARGSGHRCASGAAARAASGSPAGVWRCAG